MMIEFAKKIAQQAGKILIKYYGNAKSQNKKGAMNFVTEADIQSDLFLKAEIKKHFPMHHLLSEEDEIHSFQNSSDLWVIDPLDGTTNFKFQIPLFCVSVSYIKNGQVVIGVVYDPLHQELFWAEKGKYAYLNNKILKNKDIWTLQNSLIAFDGKYELNGMKRTLEICSKLDNYPATIKVLGSAALAISYLAAGRLNLYFSDFSYPWDVSASSLIAQEAGIKVINFDRSSFNIFSKSFLGGSPKLLSEFLALI